MTLIVDYIILSFFAFSLVAGLFLVFKMIKLI